jgi:hypothetical protein
MSDQPQDSPATSFFISQAREKGPITTGEYRAVVIESDASPSHQDFSSLAAACAYADDAASENSSDVGPVAKVLDSQFKVVHVGKSGQP